MGMKDNFSQAFKELLDGRPAADGASDAPDAAPAQEPAVQAPAADTGVVPYTPDVQVAEPVGTTIISASTVIVGEIKSNSNIDLQGCVRGDITSSENIRLSGKVVGNVTGRQVSTAGLLMQGDLVASAQASVDRNSVIVGNITGQSVTLDGQVKGNVTAEKAVILGENTLLVGNVSAQQIAVSVGARLKGAVNIVHDADNEAAFAQDIQF